YLRAGGGFTVAPDSLLARGRAAATRPVEEESRRDGAGRPQPDDRAVASRRGRGEAALERRIREHGGGGFAETGRKAGRCLSGSAGTGGGGTCRAQLES